MSLISKRSNLNYFFIDYSFNFYIHLKFRFFLNFDMNYFNYEPIEKTKNSCKVHTDHKVDYIKLVHIANKSHWQNPFR